MERRKIEEIKQGDVISLDKGKSKVTFNHKCMRQSGRWEVYVFGKWGGVYVEPKTIVRFYGKCDNVKLWCDEEKETYALQMWNEINAELPIKVIGVLETTYGGRLFGKRGVYSLQNKEYFTKNYTRVLKLREAMKEHKGVVDVEVRSYDDMENLEYSIAMETECYGYRNYYITLVCGDGEKVSI